MRKFFTMIVLSWTLPAAAQMTFLSQQDTHGGNYANIWGYTDSLGREYALIGCFNGTSVVNVTDPSNPVEIDYIPAPQSSWHELQVWGKYAYVVSEGGNGVQIINLSQLPDTAFLVKSYVTASYNRSHDLQIRDGFAYLTGGNSTNGVSGALDIGGIKILSLADPENPVEVGNWAENYVHDCYVRNDTIYAASIYQGIIYIIDARDKKRPSVITQFSYPNAFCHNTALMDNGQYLFTTDETASPPGQLRLWNISTVRDAVPNNNNIFQSASYGNTAIVHNVFSKGRYAYASYYTYGVQIWDVTNPSSLSIAGHYDTYAADNSANFAGAWGIYPYFPSGNIAISDIEGGLFMVSFSGKEAGSVSGHIKDTTNGLPLDGVRVTLLQDNLTKLTSGSGDYSFNALKGISTIKLSKPGYRTVYYNAAVPLNANAAYNFAMQPLTINPPTGIAATADSGQVFLQWKSPDPEVMRYRIYYGTSSNPTTLLDSALSSGDTAKVYKALTIGGHYYFRVKAVYNGFIESGYSSETDIVVPGYKPAAVQNLTASADSAQITLTWSANANGDFLRYRIFGGQSPNPTTLLDSISNRNTTTKVFNNLTNGATWYFRMTVVDTTQLESRVSQEVSVTVNPKPLGLITSLFQNSALTQYANIVVTADVALFDIPTVKVWRINDTTPVAMTALPGNLHAYSGSYVFNHAGTYTIQTRAVSIRGADSTKRRSLSVFIAKPNLAAQILTLDGKAAVLFPENVLSAETYLTSTLDRTAGSETVYTFGPDQSYDKNLRVEILYDQPDGGDLQKLFIYQREGGTWVPLKTGVIAESHKLVAVTRHLGAFKVVYSPSSEETSTIVSSFSLAQNFPNPFNPSTTITYDLPSDGRRVTLAIYNTLGQKIKTLFNGSQPAGHYEVTWDGANTSGHRVASGVYLFRLEADNRVFTRKMILVK